MILRALLVVGFLLGGAAPALADRLASMQDVARADAAFARGQPRTARVELMNATDADPKNVIAWMYQARVALALRNGEAADEALDRAIGAGYPISRTLHFRAHARLLEHRPAEALAIAAADRVAPEHRGYAARMRGRACAELSNYACAESEFAAARAIAPADPGLWVDIARFRLASGDLQAAIEAADRAVILAPRNVEALVYRGMLIRDQYGLAAALPWFDRALEIDPFDIDAQLERAATLGDMGRTLEMLAATRAVQALDPGNPRAFFLQAVLAARAQQFALAEKLLDQTGGALDSFPATMLLKGITAFQRGNLSQAIGQLSNLLEAQPNNVAARRLLAAAQWRAGDAQGVLATARAEDTNLDPYMLTLAGRALEVRGDREGASAYLDRAAKGSFSGPPPAVITDSEQPGGDAATQAAIIHDLIAAGDASQAVGLTLALERANPGAPDAHMLAGEAWIAANQPAHALAAFERAANLRFSRDIALRMIAALNRIGRTEEAFRVLDLFLAQHPMDVPARLLQANLLMTKGRFSDAADVLEGLQNRLGQRDVAIATNLAWCRYRTGHVQEALKLAGLAYRIAPANPIVSHSYGWILFKSGGDRRNAIALLRQAAAQAPNWGLAKAHLTQAETVPGSRSIG